MTARDRMFQLICPCAYTGILQIASSVPASGTHQDLCWDARACYQPCSARRLVLDREDHRTAREEDHGSLHFHLN